MLWCVWQALNPLFIHVTFTAIVRGAYRPTYRHVPLAIAILLVLVLWMKFFKVTFFFWSFFHITFYLYISACFIWTYEYVRTIITSGTALQVCIVQLMPKADNYCSSFRDTCSDNDYKFLVAIFSNLWLINLLVLIKGYLTVTSFSCFGLLNFMWVRVYSLTSHLTHNRSLRGRKISSKLLLICSCSLFIRLQRNH